MAGYKRKGTNGLLYYNNNNGQRPKGVIIGVSTRTQSERVTIEYLDELEFLANTAGYDISKRFIQNTSAPHPATYVRKGKLHEIADYIKLNKIKIAIFDAELSGGQINNIGKICDCIILDRSDLILNIFEKRAKTAQSKIQVELAQLQYLLPRLRGMWSHLERQRGGTATRGGAGEKEIETDRRVIAKKLTKLKKNLKQISKQAANQRKRRGEFIRVALVGYTNVGKTTLMNKLSHADLFAENKLFATLDTTVRKAVLKNIPFLLSDTVGFIRKLPHHLIESFKTTLFEATEADILLHVVDLSHPNFEDHINVVNETLSDIGAGDIQTIMIFNKIDRYYEDIKKNRDPFITKKEVLELRKSWMAKMGLTTIFISALKDEQMDELKELLHQKIIARYKERYPYQAKQYS